MGPPLEGWAIVGRAMHYDMPVVAMPWAGAAGVG